jgi:hypothetical protein
MTDEFDLYRWLDDHQEDYYAEDDE